LPKLLLTSFLASLALMTVCAPTASGGSRNDPAVVRARHHTLLPVAPLATVVIRLERDACFGTCPVYSVELRGTGDAIYEGGCFTMVPGRRTERIDPRVIAELMEQFRKADFWSLQPAYRAQITDSPTNRVTLTIGGQTKTVEDYVGKMVGMPPEVTALEDAIDRATGSARWTVSDEPTLQKLEAEGLRFDSREGARMLALARLNRREDLARFLAARGAPESPPTAGLICGGQD
jgi:hypothetical protein